MHLSLHYFLLKTKLPTTFCNSYHYLLRKVFGLMDHSWTVGARYELIGVKHNGLDMCLKDWWECRFWYTIVILGAKFITFLTFSTHFQILTTFLFWKRKSRLSQLAFFLKSLQVTGKITLISCVKTLNYYHFSLYCVLQSSQFLDK